MDKDAKQTCKHIVKGSHVMIKQQFKWLYKSQFKIFTSFRCPFKKKLKKKKTFPRRLAGSVRRAAILHLQVVSPM